MNIYYILPETTKIFSVCKFVFSLNIMDLSATQTLLLVQYVPLLQLLWQRYMALTWCFSKQKSKRIIRWLIKRLLVRVDSDL